MKNSLDNILITINRFATPKSKPGFGDWTGCTTCAVTQAKFSKSKQHYFMPECPVNKITQSTKIIQCNIPKGLRKRQNGLLTHATKLWNIFIILPWLPHYKKNLQGISDICIAAILINTRTSKN